MHEELNCPNCGSPITSEKCPCCGAIFYDFASIAADAISYIKFTQDGKTYLFKTLLNGINTIHSGYITDTTMQLSINFDVLEAQGKELKNEKRKIFCNKNM